MLLLPIVRFWSAYLMNSKDKVVIAPISWLLDRDDIIVSNRIKINTKD